MTKTEKLIYLRERGVKNISGNRIREARLNCLRVRKMSQSELAERMCEQGCPMSRLVIGRIENGSRVVTDIELLAFSRALEVDARTLLLPISLKKKNVGAIAA